MEIFGTPQYYVNFLHVFANYMEGNGLKKTLAHYLFDGTDIAKALFDRLFSGLLHPLIHLGFGLEFDQPAIVVEALASAASHADEVAPLLRAAEREAEHYNGPEKTIAKILDEVASDDRLNGIVTWEDANKIEDGIMKRRMDIVPQIMGQFKVKEGQVYDKR